MNVKSTIIEKHGEHAWRYRLVNAQTPEIREKPHKSMWKTRKANIIKQYEVEGITFEALHQFYIVKNRTVKELGLQSFFETRD